MRTHVLLLGLLYYAGAGVGACAGEMPVDMKQIFADRIGHWTSVTTWNDQKTSGSLTNTWSADKQSIVSGWMMFQSDGVVNATEVMSWDSENDAIVVRGTTTRGDYWLATYDQHAKNKWSGRGTGMWNGKPWDSPIEVEWSKNGWRYEDTTEGKPFVSIGKRVQVDATVSAREHMKALKAFIGTWKRTQPGAEYLGNSPKLKQFVGRPVTRTVVARWTVDRTAQIVQHVVDLDGEFTIKVTELRGWDAAAGAIRGYSFTSAGGAWKTIWHKEGDQWVVDYRGVNLEGDEGSGQLCFEFNGPDEMTVSERNVLYAGKPAPSTTAISRRVAAPRHGKKKK